MTDITEATTIGHFSPMSGLKQGEEEIKGKGSSCFSMLKYEINWYYEL